MREYGDTEKLFPGLTSNVKVSVRQLLDVLFLNADEPVLLVDPFTLTILAHNQLADKQLGFDGFPVSISEVLVPSLNTDVINKFLQKKKCFEYECKIKLKKAHLNSSVKISPLALNDRQLWVIRLTIPKTIAETYQETEKRLSVIFESINEMVYNVSIDRDGNRKMEYISPQIEQIFGFTAKEYAHIAANPIVEYYHPDDLEKVNRIADRLKVAGSDEVISVQYRFRPKFDSHYIWVEEKIFPKYDDNGWCIAGFGLLRNIDDRKKVETRLKDSEERFRMLSDATQEGIVLSDAGRIIDTNDQFARMFGYKPREVIGMDMDRLMDDKAYKEKEVEKMIYRGSDDAFVTGGKKKNGDEIILQSQVRHMSYEGRQVKVSVIFDITEPIRREEQLAKSKESFRNLVHYSPNGILIHFDGLVAFSNPAALNLLGYNHTEDILGKHISQLVLPEYKDLIERRLEIMKTKGGVEFQEVRILRPDQTEIEVGIQSVKTTFDGCAATQVILLDLEYQKQLDREQLRAQLAEENNRRLAEEIRERKRAQKMLQETQKFARSIIDSSLDMIMASSFNDGITEFNLAAIKQYGYSTDEIKGKDSLILYANKAEYKRVQLAMKEKGAFSGEIQNRKKDGTLFTSYLAASYVRDQDGEIRGAMGVSRDITESLQNQKKIQEQSGKIKAIFESSTHLIWSVNKEKRLTSFNKNFSDTMYDMYHFNPSLNHRLIPDKSYITREYNRLWNRKYNAALKGRSQHFETSITDEKGNIKWLEIFLNPIYDAEENIQELSCIGQDITYKKMAERKIKDQAAKINSIFESTSHMMIWTLDKKMEITSYNKNFSTSCERLMNIKVEIGIDYRDVIGRFMVKEEFDVMNTYVKSALQGKPQMFEVRFIGNHGEDIWMEAFLNPIFLEMGKVREISCLAHEITEKKRTEKQIKQSLKEKEVLLKEVHHRVKNNLQVISSILNLQSSYVKDKNTLEILKESQNRIKSMSFIHESLYQTKNFSSIDFSDYILNLSKNLVHSYRVYNDLVDLNLDFDKVYLNLDQAIPCGLIINELVSNALKYAFGEEEEGEIYISFREREEEVIMKVEDTGIGLPEGFDYRNTDSLGLQLVVTLVEQLDGNIALRSKEGTGTKYLITFKKLTN